MAKGNADCHIPNDKFREGWERVFGKRNEDSRRCGEHNGSLKESLREPLLGGSGERSAFDRCKH